MPFTDVEFLHKLNGTISLEIFGTTERWSDEIQDVIGTDPWNPSHGAVPVDHNNVFC